MAIKFFKVRICLASLGAIATLAGCDSVVGGSPDGLLPGPNLGQAGDGSLAAMEGTGMLGTGGAGSVVTGTGDNSMVIAPSGGSSALAAGAAQTGTEAPIPVIPDKCIGAVSPGRAPLRRITQFEFDNAVESLLGDDSRPGTALPPELLGNGYGNDADNQPVSSFLIEQYGVVAESIVARMLGTPEQVAALAPCANTATPDTESACARAFIEDWASRAYRHPLAVSEADELHTFWQEVRAYETFPGSISALVEFVLQSPDFLYRLEFGEPDATNPALRRPTGYEMAARLSFLFWGTTPDDALQAAAESGELSTNDGVLARATAMLEDPRTRTVTRSFFEHFLPLNTLTDLARDPAQYPTFSSRIGSLMREETHTFLDYEIFEGPGTWTSALTAPYTFVNETLANYYGIPGVTGDEFRKVDVDTTKRLGLLTQGGIQTGTTISNFTNPVRRGVFLLRNMMCVDLPPPPESIGTVTPPDPYSGLTGRERYTAHSQQALCAGCHGVMDPPGFGLENYDAVGLWRDTENGVTIDASGKLLPAGGVPFNGPIELVNVIASNQGTYDCFASNWMMFAYGRALDAGDECTAADVEVAFYNSGNDVKELLLALTQTDAFLYLPPQEM